MLQITSSRLLYFQCFLIYFHLMYWVPHLQKLFLFYSFSLSGKVLLLFINFMLEFTEPPSKFCCNSLNFLHKNSFKLYINKITIFFIFEFICWRIVLFLVWYCITIFFIVHEICLCHLTWRLEQLHYVGKVLFALNLTFKQIGNQKLSCFPEGLMI